MNARCGKFRIGGNGQIRTADLSLRRRPLYPTELRPHTVYIVTWKQFLSRGLFRARTAGLAASKPLVSDIGSVVHSVEVNLVHAMVGTLNRFR